MNPAMPDRNPQCGEDQTKIAAESLEYAERHA